MSNFCCNARTFPRLQTFVLDCTFSLLFAASYQNTSINAVPLCGKLRVTPEQTLLGIGSTIQVKMSILLVTSQVQISTHTLKYSYTLYMYYLDINPHIKAQFDLALGLG